MHALFVLWALLPATLGAAAVLLAARRRRRGTPLRRRGPQLLVLAAPLLGLAVGLAGLHHFAGRACLAGAPAWDRALGVGLPVVMGLAALGALGLGLVRLALLRRLVAARGAPAGPELHALAARVAAAAGAPAPRLALCALRRPLALTWGLARPGLLLSTWMVDHLDGRELEAVLAHELGHAARRDPLVGWLAAVLRDAFFYLPTSRVAFRRLRREQEVVADDLAVRATGRPLALARALAQVWPDGLGGGARAAGGAPGSPLLGAAEPPSVEGRIERLLAAGVPGEPARAGAGAPAAAVASVGAVLALEAAGVTTILAQMGCGPGAPLAVLRGLL